MSFYFVFVFFFFNLFKLHIILIIAIFVFILSSSVLYLKVCRSHNSFISCLVYREYYFYIYIYIYIFHLCTYHLRCASIEFKKYFTLEFMQSWNIVNNNSFCFYLSRWRTAISWKRLPSRRACIRWWYRADPARSRSWYRLSAWKMRRCWARPWRPSVRATWRPRIPL